jgi:hypothetical protein
LKSRFIQKRRPQTTKGLANAAQTLGKDGKETQVGLAAKDAEFTQTLENLWKIPKFGGNIIKNSWQNTIAGSFG